MVAWIRSRCMRFFTENLMDPGFNYTKKRRRSNLQPAHIGWKTGRILWSCILYPGCIFSIFSTTLRLYLVSLSLKRDTRYNKSKGVKQTGCIWAFLTYNPSKSQTQRFYPQTRFKIRKKISAAMMFVLPCRLRFLVANFAGLKPPAHCMEALRAGASNRF